MSGAEEERTREIGRALFRRIGRGPSPLERAWWDEQLMGLTMDDPEVKVQLFRFIDALPMLAEPASVRRHLQERSEEHTSELQSLMRLSYAVFCLKKKK